MFYNIGKSNVHGNTILILKFEIRWSEFSCALRGKIQTFQETFTNEFGQIILHKSFTMLMRTAKVNVWKDYLTSSTLR